MEYTYCSFCPRLCYVRSKLRDDTNEFTAHLCYLTRLRMVADEQACREANERAQRQEDAEAARGRQRRRPRARRVPEVRLKRNEYLWEV